MIARLELSTSKYYQLRDGKNMRYALFEPEKARGTFLIAPGRREFIEKKYAEMGKELLDRGFRLIFFEWRGQGYSDRPLPGALRQRDHILSFETHLNDLNAFCEHVVRPCKTGPLFVTGHSMGGHLIVRWLIERQMIDQVAGVLLTAPMLALSSLPMHTVARAMTWSAVRLGHGADYAPAQHDYNDQDCEFKNNPLTHDPERFALMEKYFKTYPELMVGGVTWAWLEAALQSLHHIQHRKYLEQLQLPILSIIGGKDHVTPTLEVARVIRRLPKARNVVIPDALHDILNESDIYRLEAWKHIDTFLREIMPA